MEKLSLNPDEYGVCYGLACMATMAFLLGKKEYSKFLNRLDSIEKLNPDDLDIKKLDQNIINFLQSVKLFQDPDEYPYLYNTKLSNKQNILQTSLVAQSIALEKQGGMSKIKSFIGSYSKNEFMTYLTTIQELDGIKRCPIQLSSHDHTVMIAFDPEKQQWHLNNHGKETFFDINKIDKAVEEIFNGFYSTNTYINTNLIINSEIFSLKKNYIKMGKLFRKWKQSKKIQSLHKITAKKIYEIYPLTAKKTYVKSPDNNTLFEIACCYNDVETVKKIISLNSDDTKNLLINLNTLWSAVNSNNLEIVELLLENFENIKLNREECQKLLEVIINNKNKPMLELLLQKKILDITDETAKDFLVSAMNTGYVDMVELLLEKRVSADFKGAQGKALLESAVNTGHVAIVNLLLEKIVDVNFSNLEGWTLLKNAVDKGYVDVVELLLEKGVNVNFNGKNKVLFEIAINKKHPIILKLLLKKQSELNNVEGTALLISAIQTGYVSMVNLLLAKGANVNFEKKGQAMLQNAVNEKHIDMVKLLLSKGVDVVGKSMRLLVGAVYTGYVPMVNLLLEKGANINFSNNTGGKLLLNLAMRNNDGVMLDALLDKLDVEVTSLEGNMLLRSKINSRSLNAKVSLALCESVKKSDITTIKSFLKSKKCKLLPVEIEVQHLKDDAKWLEKTSEFNELLSKRCVTGDTLKGFNVLHKAILSGPIDIIVLLIKAQLTILENSHDEYCEISHYDLFKLRYGEDSSSLDAQKKSCADVLLLSKLGFKLDSEDIEKIFQNGELANAIYSACQYVEKRFKNSNPDNKTIKYIDKLLKNPKDIKNITEAWIQPQFHAKFSSKFFSKFLNKNNENPRYKHAKQHDVLKNSSESLKKSEKSLDNAIPMISSISSN